MDVRPCMQGVKSCQECFKDPSTWGSTHKHASCFPQWVYLGKPSRPLHDARATLVMCQTEIYGAYRNIHSRIYKYYSDCCKSK